MTFIVPRWLLILVTLLVCYKFVAGYCKFKQTAAELGWISQSNTCQCDQ